MDAEGLKQVGKPSVVSKLSAAVFKIFFLLRLSAKKVKKLRLRDVLASGNIVAGYREIYVNATPTYFEKSNQNIFGTGRTKKVTDFVLY